MKNFKSLLSFASYVSPLLSMLFLASCSSETATFGSTQPPPIDRRGVERAKPNFEGEDIVVADNSDQGQDQSGQQDDGSLSDENGDLGSDNEGSSESEQGSDQSTTDNSGTDTSNDSELPSGDEVSKGGTTDENETSKDGSSDSKGGSGDGQTSKDGPATGGDSTTDNGSSSDNDSSPGTGNPTDERNGPGIPPTDVAEICEHQENVKEVYKQIKFAPPTTSCDWGKNGNLSKLDSFVRARREQIQKLDLTGNNVVCSVEFSLPQQNIEFDDEIFLLFNNYVLAASRNYTYALPKTTQLFYYDWDAIANQPYQATEVQDYYCLGEAEGLGTCVMPYTQTSGALQLKFDDSILQSISARSSLSDHSFGLVTIGDNNASDCIHTGLTFDVTVRYAPITK
jgi:hypothetical protein